MIEKKLVQVDAWKLESFTCDKCKRRFPYDKFSFPREEDGSEMMVHRISFMGGYSSVFGDCVHVACDLCDPCMMELIGPFYRLVDQMGEEICEDEEQL